MTNREYQARYRAKIRKQIIDKYGGKCACCGEEAFKFLTIEHVNGDGSEHRRSHGNNYYGMLRELRDAPVSDAYTVLCYNCNCARGHYGHCPHESGKELL